MARPEMTPRYGRVIVARMEGVTTAIVAFIFAGVIWPHLVKNKVQFYAAVLMVALIILFDSMAHIFGNLGSPGGSNGLAKVAYAFIGLIQIGALAMLILATGMSAKELGGEVFNTIDVVRRGGEKETIIVPLTGEKPKPRARDVGVAGSPEAIRLDAARGASVAPPAPAPIHIDPERDIAAEEAALDAAERAASSGAPVTPTPPAPAAPPRRRDDSSIPLE